MAINRFRGDAQGRAQVTHVTPDNVEIGDIFTLTINRKDISVTATEASVENVVSQFVTILAITEIEEFTEVSGSSGEDDAGNVTHLVLTGGDDGKPFTVTAGTTEGGIGISIEETIAGDPGRNEKQRITLPGAPTGGTFTLTFDGETTGTIAYNASAATVLAALEALSNIAPGDVSVSGSAGGPWTLEFLQAYANVDVELITGDGTSLTYGAGAKPVRVQLLENGAAGINERQLISWQATSGTFTITFGTETTSAIAYNASASTIQTALEALSNIAAGDVEVTLYQISGFTYSYYVEFKQAYRGIDVATLVLDGSSLDGGNAVRASIIQQGAASTPTIVRITKATGNSGFALRFKHPLTGVISQSGYIPTASATNAYAVAGILRDTPGYSAADFEAVATTTESLPYYDIAFKGAWNGVEVSLVADVDAEGIDNGSVEVVPQLGTPPTLSILQEGSNTPQNARYSVSLIGALGGTFTLGFVPDTGGAIQTTAAIAYNATAAVVKAALEALTNLDTCTVTGSDGGPWIVEFTGTHAGKPAYLSAETANAANLTGGLTEARTTRAAAAGINERQTISLGGRPAGGTFTLSFEGQTTGNIDFDADATEVQTALEALSNIAPGDVEVVGSAGGPWDVTFGGAYKWADVALITGDGTNLTGGVVEVSTIQTYEAKVNEVQTVTVEQAQGGTFTLTYDAVASETIPYNASASVVEGALERVSTIGVGNVQVSGDAGGPYAVTFTGTLEGTDVDLLVAEASGLTGSGSQTFVVSQETAPTGPEFFDNAENWSTGSLPVDGDTIVFEGSVNCRYGLSNASIGPAKILLRNFDGEIGLPSYNESGYVEYREKYLTLGGGADTIELVIGEGEGASTALARFAFGTATVNARILNTGSVNNSDRPAVFITNTNVASEFDIYRGSVGFAYEADETSSIGKLRVGFVDDENGDATVYVGEGVVDIPAIELAGGSLDLNTGTDSIVVYGGTARIDGDGDVDSLVVRGGILFVNTIGTIGGSPTISGEGVVSFAQDLRPKTVTNAFELYGDSSQLLDPYKVISNLRIDYNETTRFGDLGSNFKLTRGATT